VYRKGMMVERSGDDSEAAPSCGSANVIPLWQLRGMWHFPITGDPGRILCWRLSWTERVYLSQHRMAYRDFY